MGWRTPGKVSFAWPLVSMQVDAFPSSVRLIRRAQSKNVWTDECSGARSHA